MYLFIYILAVSIVHIIVCPGNVCIYILYTRIHPFSINHIFLAVHVKSFPFLNTRTTWKIMIRVYGQRFFFFFSKRRNLQLPNDLARRYVMRFDSKKREHSYIQNECGVQTLYTLIILIS